MDGFQAVDIRTINLLYSWGGGGGLQPTRTTDRRGLIVYCMI
jgi:hypothetical protein